jgi:Na+/melibiose symporter-like transporter
MGDVADYREWKTHRRATGTVTAGVVFVLLVRGNVTLPYSRFVAGNVNLFA